MNELKEWCRAHGIKWPQYGNIFNYRRKNSWGIYGNLLW